MNNFGILRTIAWRNLWRNPKRTLITLIVVTVGLWSILAFSMLLNAWAESSRQNALGLLIGQGQIHAAGYMDDPNIDHLMPPPDGALRDVLDSDGVAHWVARLQLPGVVQSEYKTLPITILGVDPAGEREISLVPDKIVEGRYLNGLDDDAVIIGANLAKRLKTTLGRRIILMSTGADGYLEEYSFDIVGIFDADQGFEDSYVFTGRSLLQEYMGLDDEIAQISFVLPDESGLPAMIDTLKAAAPDLDIRDWKQVSVMAAAMNSAMKSIIYIWLGIMIIMMSIGIINTQLMAVFERTQEFGLIRAIGLKPRMVLWLVTLESALLMAVGMVLGVILAVLTYFGFQGGLDLSGFSRAMEAIGSGQVLYPQFAPADFVIYPVLIWVIGVLVALWPAYRAQKISPVEAMRHAT